MLWMKMVNPYMTQRRKLYWTGWSFMSLIYLPTVEIATFNLNELLDAYHRYYCNACHGELSKTLVS